MPFKVGLFLRWKVKALVNKGYTFGSSLLGSHKALWSLICTYHLIVTGVQLWIQLTYLQGKKWIVYTFLVFNCNCVIVCVIFSSDLYLNFHLSLCFFFYLPLDVCCVIFFRIRFLSINLDSMLNGSSHSVVTSFSKNTSLRVSSKFH